MSRLATGWVSIHPLRRTWRLHISAKNSPRALLIRKRLRIQFGSWRKDLLITHKRPSPHTIKAKIRIRSQKNRYTIGPLIGILTVAGGGRFRGVQSNFIDIIETGRKKGAFVYVVPIENIDWKSKTVQGYLFYSKEKKWIKERLPLPHVLYNRIPNRMFEEQAHVKAALEQLSTMRNLTLYNPQFFNKQQLYAALQRDPDITPYLPQTVTFTSKAQLYHMLSSYSFVYIKPVNGMAGKGIYRVQKITNGGYLVQYQEQDDTVSKRFSSKGEVWTYLAPLIKQNYVIQQGIDLATFDNKLFDVRLLAQKNGRGEWEVTGAGIRLAGAGKITTHVPRGGSIQPPEDILMAAFPHIAPRHLLTSVRRMALRIARSLEKEWQTLGEVSMDIGIDKNMNIWFIEANAKPGKFDEPHIRKLSLQRIVEYAQHKAKFIEVGES
ncbi:YheC/YheD family endospore coat-associated protein [Aneurinibacillus aneurinilyticus]|uniref:YheC/YheD family endospore coat-associated protein n=1 Tax=Aneurinibacillus aneurinilyticus TaxID=1391 RepID=UPI0035243BC3